MHVVYQIGLGLLGIGLVFLIKLAKFKNQLSVSLIAQRYLFSILWSAVAVTLFTVLVNVVPDLTGVLQVIGINLQLPTGELNNTSFVMLGITLFYFVNDGTGNKDLPPTDHE